MTDKPTGNEAALAATESATDGTADLEALLAEGEQLGRRKPEKQRDQASSLLAKFKPVIDFAEAEMTSRAVAETNTALKTAIDFVKSEEAIKDVPDKVIRGLLGAYADEDESVRTAFVGRKMNPGAWTSKLAEVRTKIVEELKPLSEKRVASDVLAARASISGETATKVEPSKVSPQKLYVMPKQEWDAFIQDQLAASGR